MPLVLNRKIREQSGATVLLGDMRDMVPKAGKFHACITDPPYHLASIVKRFGAANAAPAKSNGATGVFARASAGFMGKTWDGGDIAFRPEAWGTVYDALLPGAHLAAFGSPRNYHRMACAIEDAGFEIRESLLWLYGSGFPKSHDVTMDAWEGWGTSLKPAYEIIVLARKPLDGTVSQNVWAHGTGALNIKACGVHHPSDPVRWPANVLHDGCLPEPIDRYFYCAKASKAERLGSAHPTVKPLALMRWLCRLVTPPGGTILDPFAGSGTTGEAALLEGFRATLIERDAENLPTIGARLSRARGTTSEFVSAGSHAADDHPYAGTRDAPIEGEPLP